VKRMTKEPTSIYMEKMLKEQLRALGINISGLVSSVGEVLVENPLATAEELALKVLKDELGRIETRQKEVEIENVQLTRRHDHVTSQISAVQQRVVERKSSQELAELFRELNTVIQVSDYDVDEAWKNSLEIRKKIEELNQREITPEMFQKMVERLESSWR